MRIPGILRPFLAAVGIAAIGVSIRPASVQAQTGTTTYRACYVPGSGTVYRIGVTGTPTACKSSTHVEFQWTGFAGAIDPTIVFSSVNIDAGDTVVGTAECPIDSIMYTGGFALHSDQLHVLASAPDPGPSAQALRTWAVQVKNEGSAPTSFGVYARCVKS